MAIAPLNTHDQRFWDEKDRAMDDATRSKRRKHGLDGNGGPR